MNTTRLFDAALKLLRESFGDKADLDAVAVRSTLGKRLTFRPCGWELSPEASDHPRLNSPGAVAEILATFIEIGHRMTRQGLCDAMEKAGRRRAESAVGECLTQLVRFGIVDNRNDISPRGYGIVGND